MFSTHVQCFYQLFCYFVSQCSLSCWVECSVVWKETSVTQWNARCVSLSCVPVCLLFSTIRWVSVRVWERVNVLLLHVYFLHSVIGQYQNARHYSYHAGYPFNHGALLAAAHLLSGSDPALHIAVGIGNCTLTQAPMLLFTTAQLFSFLASYLDKFSGNSPWKTKVKSCCEQQHWCLCECTVAYTNSYVKGGVTPWEQVSSCKKCAMIEWIACMVGVMPGILVLPDYWVKKIHM